MKKPITVEFFQRLVQGFREIPGHAAHAAEAAGCDRRLARKAWFDGIRWASEGTGARRPIKDIIEEEQAVARARLEEEAALQRKLTAEQEAKRQIEIKEKAARDATDSRVQEAQVVRLARGSAANLLASVGSISAGAAKVAQQVRAALDRLAAAIDPGTGEAKPLTLIECRSLVGLVNTLSTSVRQANDAASRAMEMERLLLGEPGSYVGVVNYDTMTLEEAERRVQFAARAFARAREKGLIKGEIVPELPLTQEEKKN